MKFKTELHCHSRTVSQCASITPQEIVEKYLERGYTTVVLADHLSPSTFEGKRYQGSNNWQEQIDYYMNGYYALRDAAAGKLHILQGCELRIHGCPSDFLIYGITEEFIRATPTLLDKKPVKEMCAQLREAGFLVYQAHPFRNNMCITNPAHLDGVEVYNAHPRHDSRNDLAEMWAKRYALRELSGSDVHDADDTAGGGILTDAPITTMQELVEVLRGGNYTLLRDGRPGTQNRHK